MESRAGQGRAGQGRAGQEGGSSPGLAIREDNTQKVTRHSQKIV